jgi:hypothetical protein
MGRQTGFWRDRYLCGQRLRIDSYNTRRIALRDEFSSWRNRSGGRRQFQRLLKKRHPRGVAIVR